MTRVFTRFAFATLAFSAACAGSAPAAPAGHDEPVASTSPAASAVNVFHASNNGGDAYAESFTDVSQSYIEAFENKSGKSRAAFVYFFSYAYDPNSLTCQTETICWDPNDPSTCYDYEYCYYANYTYSNGYGSIPIRDFSVGKKTAELHTDVAKDPNFSATTCTQNGCSAATGKIDVSWAANGYYSHTTSGTSTTTYAWGSASYTSRSSGTSSSSSANVDGQLLGTTLQNAYGEINTSQGASVSKDIFKN
jgi:hypothetical protein